MLKRLLFLGAASLIVVAMSSCRKNRTCQCTDTDGDTYNYTILLQKKKEAEATCDSYESSYEPNCEII